MKIQRSLLMILLFLSIIFPQAARSAEKPLWELGVGFATLLLPDYRGSDEYRVYPLPYPYVVYRGDFLRIDERQISGRIFKTDRVLLDVSIYGYVPVESNDNNARQGMPDLDPTFEIGPSLKISLLESKEDKYLLNITMPVRAVFSTDFGSVKHEGWLISPRINFEKNDIIPETGLNLGISAGPMFADRGYHEYFYTVDHAYATAIRPAYYADGGYSGSSLTAGLSKGYKQFILSAFVSADFLQGAVFEDSPLVKRKTSFMTGISLAWIFLKSEKMVNVEK